MGEEYIGFGEEMFAGAVGGSVVAAFLVIYLLFLLAAMAFSVASYVLHSLGLYTIANRRGIHNAWLAWVPLGNLWTMGSISDQYQYLVKGKIKNRRKVLLGLSIGFVAVYIAWLVATVTSMFANQELTTVAYMFGGMFALLTVAIVLTVLQYIAYYDLFHSCHPGNAVLYLVLSIIFPVTTPFFVFACRKKDLGMPPRKKPAPVVTEEPVVESVEEPTAEAAEESAENPTEAPAELPAPAPEEGFAQPEEFEDA